MKYERDEISKFKVSAYPIGVIMQNRRERVKKIIKLVKNEEM